MTARGVASLTCCRHEVISGSLHSGVLLPMVNSVARLKSQSVSTTGLSRLF
ncbi:hypothetical protein KCP76_24590 [Salmonella enterica subsp. enterica serovar Weltevreden]|nr:hypothetical protein KCP76_24590 [Salmonella enterica subsp. enterica serovar Weltevreden]